MDIEDIAKIDLFLRSNCGLEHILDVDSLIVVSNDQNSVNKLKDAAYRLQNLNNPCPETIHKTWQNLFVKQVRYSVNRAKQKNQKSE